MRAGTALLGVVTASIASWLIERVREVEADVPAVTQREIAQLRAEIRALRQVLRAARTPDAELSVMNEYRPGLSVGERVPLGLVSRVDWFVD
jgi:hypothetical protein